MGKHLSFWIGFFAAALLVVPVALGIMGVAEERLRQMAVVLFAGVSVLVVLLVVALFFRDAILRRVLGRSEVALEDVAGSLVSAVAAASEGDRDKAATHARALVQGGVGWYAWSSFYRWVIGSALGLLLAFGAFVGTVLLFEQTRTLRVQTERIGEQTELMSAQTALMEAQTERLREQTEAAAMQNEIMTLNLVNQLREQMLASVETLPLGEWLRSFGWPGITSPIVAHSGTQLSCGVGLQLEHELNSQPSEATLGAIEELTQSASLGNRVIDALKLLTQDSNSGVSLGAIQVLDKIDQPFTETEVHLNNVLVDKPTHLRNPQHQLVFAGSYVANLNCPDCELRVETSIYHRSIPLTRSGHGNMIVNADVMPIWPGILIMPDGIDLPEDWNGTALETGLYFFDFATAWLVQSSARATCEELATIARINPMLKMMSYSEVLFER